MRWQIFRASDGDTVKVQPYDKSMKNIVPKVGEVPHESGRPSVGVCSLQRVTSGMTFCSTSLIRKRESRLQTQDADRLGCIQPVRVLRRRSPKRQ